MGPENEFDQNNYTLYLGETPIAKGKIELVEITVPVDAPKPERILQLQPRREGFYAPGIVSWELDIYAPHSPPTGRKLTASTSTGAEQGHSPQPTGQLYSPPQATSQQAQATAHRARASRSQQQGHSLQPAATQHKPQPTANSGQHNGQPARRHPNARARFQPNAPAPESRRARARVGTPGGAVKGAGAEAQNFFRYESIFFTSPALAEKIEGGQKTKPGERGGEGEY